MTTKISSNIAEDFYGLKFNAQTALHGLTRSQDGDLTYTKLYVNQSDTIDMSDGNGQAYDSIEEFVRGTTESGVPHNTVPRGQDEVSRKAFLGETFNVKINDPNGASPILILNESVRTLTLAKGATYKFYTNDPSTEGFPIFISTTQVNSNFDNEYLYGILNSRSAYGGKEADENAETTEPLTFTVPYDAPDTLYLTTINNPTVFAIIITNSKIFANLKYRKYDQVRFDDKKVTYFINTNGFLVARYNQDYTYS